MSQNINIRYNVDKSSVDASNASVERAKHLTDQLKQSAQSYSQTAAKGNKEYQTSIESVRQRMIQLRTQIDLTARSDTKRLNELISQYKQAKSEVDRFNQSLSGGAKQNTTAVNGLANGFMQLYSAIRLVVAAAIVKQLVDTTLESAKLTGQIEAVGNAFRRQIPNSELLLNSLRKATKGTVNDIELMQRALKFQNFGGDVEKLPKLLEFAAVRAQQTGDSVDYLVNSIVNGIGRKSILILDNLGISATRLKEELGGAAAQSKTVEEVTAAVAKIAGEELEKMGGFAENSATQVDQLAVSVTKLKEEWAKFVTGVTEGDNGGVIGFFKEYVDRFKDLLEMYNRGISASELYAERLRDEKALKQADSFITKNLTGTREENIKALEDELEALKKSISEGVRMRDNTQKGIDWLKQEWAARRGNQYVIEENIELAEKGLEQKMREVLVEQEVYKILYAKWAILKKLNEEEENEILTLAKLKAEVEELNRIREEETSVYDKAELDRLQQLINRKQELILKLGDSIKWQKYWNDISKESIKIQDDLNAAIKKRAEDEAMDFFKDMATGGKVDISGIDFSTIEIPIEPVIGDNWGDGNEKAARTRLELRKWFQDNWDENLVDGIELSANLTQMLVDSEAASYRKRLDNLQQFYDRQNLLAGDNERYKKELALRQQKDTMKLEREQAQAQKKARKLSIVIDTAAAIAKAWVNPGYPAAIPLSVFLAAQGIAQGAIVDKAQPGFKDGVIDLKGPGTAKSDSISARLSKGESVMTAEETQSSMKTLKMIRAKKLDDKKLDRIIKTGAIAIGKDWDDSRINEHLQRIEKAIGNNDYMDQGVLLMKVSKSRDGLTKIIRSKSING